MRRAPPNRAHTHNDPTPSPPPPRYTRRSKRRPELRRSQYVREGEIQWHGLAAGSPDWSDDSRLVAFSQRDASGGGLYVAFNTGHEPAVVELPLWHGREWRLLADTGKVRGG